ALRGGGALICACRAPCRLGILLSSSVSKQHFDECRGAGRDFRTCRSRSKDRRLDAPPSAGPGKPEPFGDRDDPRYLRKPRGGQSATAQKAVHPKGQGGREPLL